MYPNLTPTLVALLGVALAVTAYIAVRRPFLRRLALRQVSRRRTEALLVTGGSVLATAVIVASLVVGDTLNYSVKQDAYHHLGPVDEIVSSATLGGGARAAAQLAPLRKDPQVDGVLTVLMQQAAASTGSGNGERAVPRAYLVGANLDQAARFGSAGGPSGLTGPNPGPGSVVLDSDLASALGARPGRMVTFYLSGRPVKLRVSRVVPTSGVAGLGGASWDGTAFVGQDLLRAVARAAPASPPATLTLVSNAGGVESGASLTGAVTPRIRQLLGPLAAAGAAVETPKRDVLNAAREVGNGLGSLFLFIGSFSIIVGVVLLMNIFVMLAEERKPEMGMLRAIGMKRSRLVRSFMIEGAVYALAASLLGLVAGLGVGRLAVMVAARIFRSGGLGTLVSLVFHVSAISLINSLAMGFLIGFGTVVTMSIRISRFNIIAAIRDLPAAGIRARRRMTVVACVAGSVLAAAGSVPVIAAGRSVLVYVLPAAAVLLAVPALLRVAPARAIYSWAAAAVLAWTALANTIRPHVLDNTSTSTYIVMGCLLAAAAVVLVSQNQQALLRPFRQFIQRPSPSGLTARVAVTYPLARPVRTGAILVMYTLIVFTLVLLSVLSTMIDSTVNQSISAASGGFALRADFNPAAPVPPFVASPHATAFSSQIAAVQPLIVAPARVKDLGPRRLGPADVSVIGLPAGLARDNQFALSSWMPQLGASEHAAWQALAADPRYVVLDGYVAVQPGMAQQQYRAGDRLTLVDPSTGRIERKIIAGIMRNSEGFTGIDGRAAAYPILMNAAAARSEFGSQAKLASALIRTAPGVSEAALAARLQGQYLTSGTVVVRIEQAVRQNYAANMGFFQLMQGFVVLGLLIAIAGLGVVMVRAVRERRREVGVLRALGFHARWIQRAFLGESALIAAEGIVLGAGLSIFVSYLLFRNNSDFSGYRVGFTVPWLAVAVIVVVAWLASIVATYLPARKASRIPPAVALRIAD